MENKKIFNGKDVHRDSTCSSHMPIQMELINNFTIKNVLEFGVGFYSTKLFLDKCEKVISIEGDSDFWFQKMKTHYSSYTNFEDKYLTSLEEVTKFVKELKIKIDLIFVDGDIFRAEETNLSFELSDIIVVHDSQYSFFQSKHKKPEDFYQIYFKEFPVYYEHQEGHSDNPWTTLFTKNKKVYEHFKNMKESELYQKYSFPYVYSEIPNQL